MRFSRFFARIIQARRLLKALDRIAAAQEAQVVLLSRLADRLAPIPVVEPSESDIRQTTGLSFSRDREQVLIQEHVEKIYATTGHVLSDDEIEQWLDGVPV